MHEHAAVALEHEQPGRRREVRREPPGVVDRAPGNDETHPSTVPGRVTGAAATVCVMVDNALLEQVMKLDTDSRLEVRDAIEASVVSEYLTPELAELLAERVADDDAANHAGYISLEELERRTQARRAERNG